MSNYIQKLNRMFQYAYHNEFTNFYPDLYGKKIPTNFTIDSLIDWRSLPFVTKDALMAVPLLERTFTEVSDASILRTSSGTSGRGVLMTLRNHDWRYTEAFQKYVPTGGLLIGDISYATEDAFRSVYPNVSFTQGDVSTMEASISLVAGSQINTFGCWLYGYDIAIPLLQKYGLCEQIEMIITFGERVTSAHYHKLQAVFPNAFIYTRYGATEIHDSELGTSAGNFDSRWGTIFNTTTEIYMELVDVETDQVIEEIDREGEIVVTMLWSEKNPSPLLRYRMGDVAFYTKYDGDPWKRQYTICGRAMLDKISVPGGFLQTPEWERVFALYADIVENDFELHYTTPKDSSQQARYELWVIQKKDFDETSFAQAFMHQVRISPERTFADAVAKGLLGAITVKKVDALSRSGQKRLRFIEH